MTTTHDMEELLPILSLNDYMEDILQQQINIFLTGIHQHSHTLWNIANSALSPTQLWVVTWPPFKTYLPLTIIDEICRINNIDKSTHQGFHDKIQQVMNHLMGQPRFVGYFTFGYSSFNKMEDWILNVLKS